MSNPVYITLTATGTSRVVNLNCGGVWTPATVSTVFGSTSMTAAYGVEYSLVDAQYNEAIGSTLAQTWTADANMPAGTSSGGQTTYSTPIAAVRLTLTAISSSYVRFSVIQGT